MLNDARTKALENPVSIESPPPRSSFCLGACDERVVRLARDEGARVIFGRLSPRTQFAFHLIVFLIELGILIWQISVDGLLTYQFLTWWGFTTQTVYFGFSTVTSAYLIRDLRDAEAGANWLDSEFLMSADGPVGIGQEALAPRLSEEEENRRSSAAPRAYYVGGVGGLGPSARALSRLSHWLLYHRDRFFYLDLPLSCFISFGFWVLLMPNKAVNEKFVSAAYITVLSSAAHGFTLVAIWADALLVRHRPLPTAWFSIFLSLTFALVYLVFNFVYFDISHLWVYPSIQAKIASEVGIAIAVYILLLSIFAILQISLRAAMIAYWRSVDDASCSAGCRARDWACGPCPTLSCQRQNQ